MRCALLLAVALVATPAAAQVLHEGVGQGGVICDTKEEVPQFIAILEAEGPQKAIEKIAGCGILTRPMMMRVTAIESHVAKKGKYLIVRYEFPDSPMPDQFGIGAFIALSSL